MRWKNQVSCLVSAGALLATGGGLAAAEPTRAAPAVEAPRREDGVATSRRTVTLRDGRKIAYIARAGSLGLVNDATRELVANVYFTSYSAERSAGAPPRPITFVFPGGPGSAGSLGASAPRIVVVANGQAKVVDNPDTLLTSTDLVFVDPVGTGYSRVTKPEHTALFYNIKGDRDSLAEFIRLYLQRFDTAESPIFLSGGSYGSARSILVARAAMDRGIPIRGIYISAEAAILSVLGSDSYYASLIAGFALVAHTHKKLSGDLMADRDKTLALAKTFAWNVYLPAIARGADLPADERSKVTAEMARLTGLKPAVIEANDLKIGQETFANALLGDQGLSVGFYDTRMTGPLQTGAYDATKDPSLMARGVAYPSLAERLLLNRELGMTSSNYYAGAFGGGWPVREGVQDWMAIKWGFTLEQEQVGSGMEIVLPTLVKLVNDGLPVMIGQGLYDWACPPFGAEYVASRVSPAKRDRIKINYYESGHGVPPAAFGADAAAFINKTLSEPSAPAPRPTLG